MVYWFAFYVVLLKIQQMTIYGNYLLTLGDFVTVSTNSL